MVDAVSSPPSLPLSIYASRGKAALLTAGGVALSCLFFAMYRDTHADAFDSSLYLLAIAVFGLGGVAGLRNVVSPRLVCTLTAEGITIDKKVPPVPWSNVDHVTLVPFRGTTLLGLVLKDPDAYISTLAPFVQKIARSAAKTFGAPIVLQPSLAGMTTDQMMELIEQVRKANGA